MFSSLVKKLVVPLLIGTAAGITLQCPHVGPISITSEPEDPPSAEECGSTAAALKQYLLNAGYNEDAAAGIMGNIKAESNYRTRVIQGGRLVDETTFVAFKNGSKTFSGGFGLAQWTSKGRVKNLQNYADSIGKMVATEDAQFGFLLKELTGSYKYGPSVLNGKTIEESTFLIYRYYETPLSSFCTDNNRDGCYNTYAPKSVNGEKPIDPVKTKSAYSAYSARLKYAKAALTIGTESCGGSSGEEGEEGGEGTPSSGAVGVQTASGLFSQTDYSTPWRKDRSTIYSSGCSLIAVANALKTLGHDSDHYNPVTLANWSVNVISGKYDTGWDTSLAKIGSNFGLNIPGTYLWKTTGSSAAKEKALREALSRHHVVIASGARKDIYPSSQQCSSSDKTAGKCVFSYNGHFIVIVGITADGKAVVGNPALANDRTWTFPLEEVLKVSNKAKEVKLI